MNILLKRVPDKLAERLSELARQSGTDRMNYIIALLQNHVDDTPFADPDIVIGFIELKNGELDEDEVDCPQCGQPLHRPHIGFDGALQPFGPMCEGCATTE